MLMAYHNIFYYDVHFRHWYHISYKISYPWFLVYHIINTQSTGLYITIHMYICSSITGIISTYQQLQKRILISIYKITAYKIYT